MTRFPFTLIKFIAIFGATVCLAAPATAQSPPMIDSISPESVLHQPIPQPTMTITGQNFVVGFPSGTNRPTITITHTTLPKVSFSTIANVNFSGTLATIPAGINSFNMLQMPMGVYDLTLSRPDGQFVTVVGGFSITPQSDPVPGAIEMRVASYWGGPILGMDISEDGTLAYIANGRMLRILDLIDESNPTELGSIYLTGVNDVKVKGDYAFVAASSPHGFCVVDVSEPAAPELVWRDTSGVTRSSVLLYGDYAYVGVNVYDISNPLNVDPVGTIPAASGIKTIDGDRLYVGKSYGSGSNSDSLRVFDLSDDPVAPPMIASADWPNIPGVRAIAANGNYVYLTVWTGQSAPHSSLLTIDVSNPSLPVITDVKEDDFYTAQDLATVDGHLLVVDSRNGPGGTPDLVRGLLVYDISTDPAMPTLASEYKSDTIPQRFYGVHTSSTRAYLTCDAEGLIILDMTTPFEPIRLGKYHSPSRISRMAKGGDYLYVLDDWGVTILDVANPQEPQVVSTYLLDSIAGITVTGMDIALQNDLLYITARNMGLEVVDVSTPADPMFVSRLFPPLPNWDNRSHLVGVAVTGDVAHVGFYDQINASNAAIRHLTIDVSDPANMFEIARSEHLGSDPASDIVLHDDLETAYTALGASNVRKIDIVDVANPHDIGAIVNASDIDLAIEGDLLFAAARSAPLNNPGLHIYNVSQPLAPVSVAYLDGGTAGAVDVQNGRAYTVGLGSYDHLNIHDVSDPAQPVHVHTIPNVGNPFGNSVLVDEPNVYVTTIMHTGSTIPALAGLAIIDIHGIEPPCPTDLDGDDNEVNVFDLFVLLSNWNSNGPGAELAEPTNIVNVFDLFILLSAWGECE